MGTPATASHAIPPMTIEEEDAIIHTRILNDERELKRVMKKYYTYRHPKNDEKAAADAREAFMLQLSAFELWMQKNLLVCEAEARQVEEYRRERQRIADEHVKLRGQIEQLKTSLEHEQLLRKRKLEYDQVAEKVNALPSRDELQESIQSLESDMDAIRASSETQDRMLDAQRSGLSTVVRNIGLLRSMGKDADTDMEPSADTSALDGLPSTVTIAADSDLADLAGRSVVELLENGELQEEKEDGEDSSADEANSSHKTLNPRATPFSPGSAAAANRLLRVRSTATSSRLSRTSSAAPSPSPAPLLTPTPSFNGPRQGNEDDDIEMGEVAEDTEERKAVADAQKAALKKAREADLEEGEATDASSDLSEPPDD